MPTTLKIGLAPKKVSYFDKITKLYLTLGEPFKEITVADGADLSGLARGLFTMKPAIILLEGTFPEAEKEKFKKKYEVPFQVYKRTDAIVMNAPQAPVEEPAPEVVEGQSAGEATLFNVGGEAPEAPEDTEAKISVSSVEVAKVEKTAPKKPTTKKTTAKKAE